MAEKSGKVKCNHKNKWGFAGQQATKSKGIFLIFTTLYCKKCGEVQVRLNNIKLTK